MGTTMLPTVIEAWLTDPCTLFLLLCPCAVTPPGYFTANSATSACAPGEYRAEWKPAGQAGACVVCGDNIDSDATEEITTYAITADATPSKVLVRATAAACCEYICWCCHSLGPFSCCLRQLGDHWAHADNHASMHPPFAQKHCAHVHVVHAACCWPCI